VVALDGDHPRRPREAVTVTLAPAEDIPVVVAVRGDVVAPELCRQQVPFEFVSFVPEPSTIRCEARGVAFLAQSQGWSPITVVNSTYDVPRSRRP
jgi:hypothetical protein